MVFVLDNYDSFTYNLVQYMGELGAEIVVRRNDELTPAEVEALHPSHILISPGPCTPQDAGISIALIRHFARPERAAHADPRRLPRPSGHRRGLRRQRRPRAQADARQDQRGRPRRQDHLRRHSVGHDLHPLPFADRLRGRSARRTRSLRPHPGSEPANTIMALRHRELPIEGVQFHPESVLTTHGKQIIENFLKM